MRANKAAVWVSGVVLLVTAYLAACVTVPSVEDKPMTTGDRSMKGYELYSWQVNSKWRYALVAGTNRLKSYDEIVAPATAIKSVTELRTQLARLAKGEEIVWVTWVDDRLALPPQPVIDEIQKVCQELGLQLVIAAR